MKNIGLLGGAFDPIHAAHVQIGVAAKKQLNLDEIWVLIDKEPRNKANVTLYKHRLEMARLAAKQHDFFVIDRLTMQREGRTYGVQTLEELVEMHPGYSFTLIGGLDAISRFDTWENPEIFCKHVNFALATRAGHDLKSLENMKLRLGDLADSFRYQLLTFPEMPVSSTTIREHLKIQKQKHEHIDKSVHSYIQRNKLYGL